MKLFFKSVSVGLILSVLLSFIPFTAQCENLSDELFRLHILANSDSEEDQKLKISVRDKILEYTEDLYKDCKTKEDTINITRKNLVNILNVAQQEVYNNGYSYVVKGRITNMYFTTRKYNEFTVPSGIYDALRITIGSGEGHNWWCVMFPSFCLGSSKNLSESNLTDNDKKLISNKDEYKVRFQLFEWYEKLISMF